MAATEQVRLLVDVGQQQMMLLDAGNVTKQWAVSTAAKGLGERFGSECTPRGAHRVRIKIGAGCEPGTVFVARRPTGERYSTDLADASPGRDWILTRILWLTGCESGRNRGGATDTLRRYIYIHGCPDSEPMGRPGSHGCIRMRNADLIELFDLIDIGCPVDIQG